MTSEKEKKDSGASVFVLPEILDIARADSFLSSVNGLLDSSPKGIEIDGSAVGRITTPCIQILLSLSKTAAENYNIMIKLGKVSEVMSEAFADLGLGSTLEQWSGKNV